MVLSLIGEWRAKMPVKAPLRQRHQDIFGDCAQTINIFKGGHLDKSLIQYGSNFWPVQKFKNMFALIASSKTLRYSR